MSEIYYSTYWNQLVCSPTDEDEEILRKMVNKFFPDLPSGEEYQLVMHNMHSYTSTLNL